MPTTPTPPAQPEIVDLMKDQVNNPSLPPGSVVTPIQQQVQQNELVNTPGLQGTVAAQTAHAAAPQQGTATPDNTNYQTAASSYQATAVGNNAAQGTAAQGTVSQQGQAQAAQGEMDPNALVKTQYEKLMDFQPGQTPDWAKGAARSAEARMNARGISSSTMAGKAVASAMMDAALPIAQQDAKAFQDLMSQNLNNRQQAALQNAQAFLQMDLANLSNNQQMFMANLANRQQALLSDQAAQNAAKQFNATSEQQNAQFFSNLASQIKAQNLARQDAMSQFNIKLGADVAESNAARDAAVSQFNAGLENQRQQFNVQNQQIIDQSNAVWRRTVNTANTAAQNAANETNAQNMFNMSQSALAALWQQWRDEASWANTAAENAKTRQHNLAVAALQRQTDLDLAKKEDKDMLYQLMGQFAANLVGS